MREMSALSLRPAMTGLAPVIALLAIAALARLTLPVAEAPEASRACFEVRP